MALREGDLFGRWGGEEFLAILPEADATAATVVAERMRNELETARIAVVAGEGLAPVVLRASFGVATYPASAQSVRELLLAADQALYRAKGDGGDCIRAAVE